MTSLVFIYETGKCSHGFLSLEDQVDIHTQWQCGRFESSTPTLIGVTTTSHCNLRCQHCYWEHDMKERSQHEWDDSIRQIDAWGAEAVFAGRILSPPGIKFIRHFHNLTGKRVHLIDNGQDGLVFKHLDLLDCIDQISISIDGEPEAHDVQRNKQGSFQEAWKMVLALKDMGRDPIVSCAISYLQLPSWKRFEERLADHDVPLSVALYQMSESPRRRGELPMLEERSVTNQIHSVIFDEDAIPKIVNLYDVDHMEALAPSLSTLAWEPLVGGAAGWVAEVSQNQVKIVLRLPSIQTVSEQALLWDGKFYDNAWLTDLSPRELYDPVQAAKKATVLAQDEHRRLPWLMK